MWRVTCRLCCHCCAVCRCHTVCHFRAALLLSCSLAVVTRFCRFCEALHQLISAFTAWAACLLPCVRCCSGCFMGYLPACCQCAVNEYMYTARLVVVCIASLAAYLPGSYTSMYGWGNITPAASHSAQDTTVYLFCLMGYLLACFVMCSLPITAWDWLFLAG